MFTKLDRALETVLAFGLGALCALIVLGFATMVTLTATLYMVRS